MKIIQLQAENIKGLVAVDITPESELVVLSGENGAGKSSVLDAIYWAIAGAKNIQDKPIRDGETKARIKLDLGELVIERKFTEKGTTLTVSSDKGAVFNSPQAMLDKLCGAITFDPMEFASMKPKEQVATLQGLLELNIDFDEIEAKNALDYARRTDVNRTVKELEVKVATQKETLTGKEIPSEKLIVSELAEKINSLREKQEDKRRYSVAVTEQQQRISDIEDQIASLEDDLKEENERLPGVQAQLDEAPEVTDEQIEEAREKLNNAEASNTVFEAVESLGVQEEELEKKRTESDTFTETMERRNKIVETAISNAKMPVEGLSFTKDGVLYDNIPFGQCNTGTKTRVSAAIGIASNPDFRVMLIEQGNDVDTKGLALIEEIAEQNDFQIWIERIAPSPVSIEIKNGKVAQSKEDA